MAEQLAACAQQLFEGASGGAEQRTANAWLMQFQAREEAWQAALQLLERPARDPQTQQPLAAPELVAMQILRLKTQHEWAHIGAQQQHVVRQVLCAHNHSHVVINLIRSGTRKWSDEHVAVSGIFCRETDAVEVAGTDVRSSRRRSLARELPPRLRDSGGHCGQVKQDLAGLEERRAAARGRGVYRTEASARRCSGRVES
jgi:hypothetical protein